MNRSRKCVGSASWFKCWCRWLVLVPLAAAAAGCQEYRWRGDYVQAEKEAREQNKHLFVFYKWWLDSDSNRMLSEELSDPAVKALFQDTINLLLDKEFGPEYVEYVGKYGVTSYPASIIVAPDGKFQVQTGRIPKERFIEWVQKVKPPPAARQPPKQPAKKPASPPRAKS